MPEPSAGPDQVVIKVDPAGVCGTDLHIYLDEFETRPPVEWVEEAYRETARLMDLSGIRG